MSVDKLGDGLQSMADEMLAHLEDYKERDRKAAAYDELRSALTDLVDMLPRCYECTRPMTKALDVDCYGHCDKHGEYPGEASWAAPLRAALRLLGREATPVEEPKT